MRRLLRSFALGAVALLVTIGASSTALADTVTYTTIGVFTSTNTNVLTLGGGPTALTLTYTPVAAGTSVTPFGPGPAGATFANFGEFSASGGDGGLPTDGEMFRLTVRQVSPSSETTDGVILGAFTGMISNDASSVELSFTPGPVGTLSNAVGFGTHVFQVRNLQMNPPTSNAGLTSLNGRIYDAEVAPIPEPATMLLLGTGLVGVSAAIRRRLKANKREEVE